MFGSCFFQFSLKLSIENVNSTPKLYLSIFFLQDSVTIRVTIKIAFQFLSKKLKISLNAMGRLRDTRNISSFNRSFQKQLVKTHHSKNGLPIWLLSKGRVWLSLTKLCLSVDRKFDMCKDSNPRREYLFRFPYVSVKISVQPQVWFS